MARHYNPRARESSHMHSTGVVIYRPYQRLYAYTKPSMKFQYMKVIQFVADHPNCKRKDIIAGVWGRNVCHGNDGFMCHVFSNLLYDDYIDYDVKDYRYYITKDGARLLKKAYLNDCAKLCR